MTGGDDFEPIGTGPVATVYGGLYLALKVYPAAAGRNVVAAFEQERAALEPVRGTAPVLVADEVLELPDGRTALQMELCSLSLAELVVESGPLEAEDGLAVAHAVASALAAAHGAGVVHGGLSPHNVLFHPSGAAVVADFGVAFRRAFPAGHPSDYTAPETALDGTMDERSDLYGLGGVLHVALTGRPPSAGGDVPLGLTRLVTRLLAEDPADRPATADVVVRQLAALLEPTSEPVAPPPTAPEPTAPEPVAPPRRSGLRTRTVVGAVAGVAVLAAVPFVARSAHVDPPPAAPAPPSTSSAQPIALSLADPADHGTYVDLSWQGQEGLTFAVVVAPDGRKSEVRVAQRNRAMRVPVEEVRAYCFQVQATDGALVVESTPKAIRGAVCKT